MSDAFDIPAFLRIPQATRNAAWERNPPKPPPPYAPPQMEALRKEEKRERTKARVSKMLADRATKQHHEEEQTKRGWKVRACGSVFFMTPAQYDRIMRELPTDKHRDVLRELWGRQRALYAIAKPQQETAKKTPPKRQRVAPKKSKSVKRRA